ncbi:sulfotransferase [Epibacterium ulvae]|uniref:sulfotransferase n=1 Tax=Epibacterium ulvae TaxID=1156985 RepID=UPI001BFC4B43|nr:sulfotransferase [Epibacterium ulvae]MBT8154549.1 sulfotransferase [Epibacterium ulvae]
MASHPFLRVFVVGCSRGGTTVTQRLIADRLHLLTLPETRFFVSLIGNTDRRMFPETYRPQGAAQALRMTIRNALGLSSGLEWRNADMIPGPRRRKWSPVARIARDFQTGMDHLAQEAQAVGWLEKTPMHVHYTAEIAAHIDNAWFIHVIRDAQDTVASIWDAAQKYDDPWPIVYDRIERAVDNWNASIADSAGMVGQPRHLFVRYSSLTAQPEAVLDQISQAMGHGTGQAAPDREVRSGQMRSAAGLTSARDQAWKGAATSGQVTPARSKWDSALTPEEQTRASALIQPLPAALETAMRPFDLLLAEAAS